MLYTGNKECHTPQGSQSAEAVESFRTSLAFTYKDIGSLDELNSAYILKSIWELALFL